MSEATLVQEKALTANGFNPSFEVAFDGDVLLGSAIHVILTTSGTPPEAIFDTQGNEYTLFDEATDSHYAAHYYTLTTAAGPLTVGLTNSSYPILAIREVSGVDTDSPVAVHDYKYIASSVGTPNASKSNAMALGAGNGLLSSLCLDWQLGDGPPTTGVGFVAGIIVPGPAGDTAVTESKRVATGSHTADFTSPSAGDNLAIYSVIFNDAALRIVADPTFSLPSGTYDQSVDQMVTISCATGGASIYYTIDGTDPTVESLLYVGELTLNRNRSTAIKAKAFLGDNTPSGIVQATYRRGHIVTYDNV